ncbi:hypothetical protein [Bacillus ndiopicus]|uniref:hypothetical protein n=1 Tax=Bacillus ndiopicus TaxID=1347368 RepID=UPI000A47B93B|nr:hypothetical protein [Bacillus ndiopicus]
MKKKLTNLLMALCLVFPIGISFTSTNVAAEAQDLTSDNHLVFYASGEVPSINIPLRP